MNEVELIGVSKKYGDHVALDDVSVGFRKDKITAVIGRSGSGKSTLLKSINGLVQPSSGRILVAGQQNVQRSRIGYVIQGNGLFPHLTIAENISLPGRLVNKPDPSRVNELLSFTDLPINYSTKFPWQLSGGEQQRVALCRALFLNPPVLLMDEPFGALDTYTRRDLQKKILELRDAFRLTMVIVTHDIPEAIRLADDMLVLDKGSVQSFGPTDLIANTLPD